MLRPASLDALRTAVARPASVAAIARGRPQQVAIASLLGGVAVGRAGEPWPIGTGGQPFLGLLQVNVADAPFIPPLLEGIALMAVFIERDGDTLVVPDGRDNGDGWLIRAYPTLAELAPVAVAGHTVLARPRRLAWTKIEDLPAYEDLVDLVDPDTLERLLGDEDVEDAFGTAESGTKLGGWPALLQGELAWRTTTGEEPVFCLQVDSTDEAGLNLWDGGVLHVGRRPGTDPADPDAWVAASQML